MNKKQEQQNDIHIPSEGRLQRKQKQIQFRKRVLMCFFFGGLCFAALIGFSLGNYIKGIQYDKTKTASAYADRQNSKRQVASMQNEVKASSTDSEDWRLVLVNPWHRLPASHKIVLTQLKNGQAVDQRCYPDLQQMMDDCRAAGLLPLICSSYRSQETQQRLFNDKISELATQGYSAEKAKTQAATVVALPGTSEHELGLALDIVDTNNQNLDTNQENTPVQRWLKKNSWKYGFILRYPTSKSKITGIIYEPWHYRYVGKEVAREIFNRGICLEEYLNESH